MTNQTLICHKKGDELMAVNTQEKIKLEQEIAELRVKQSRAISVDRSLDTALSTMRSAVREYEKKYDEQQQRKKEAFEKKKFSSRWDPKLTEAIEIVRKPLQSYGENCEKAVAKLLKEIEKNIKLGASEQKVLSCVNAALSVLRDLDDNSITFYQISKTLKFQPTVEGRNTKRSLEKIRADFSSGSGTFESQIKAREEKLKRIERADKYGIPVSKLDTHEAYLTALKNYEKAKSGDELRASLNSLKALGNYLNSASLLSECDKKVKAIEEVERVEKSVADAKYALAVAEKELKEAEQDSQVSEQELKSAELKLQAIESNIDSEKETAVSDYSKKCSDNDALVSRLRDKLAGLEQQKSDAESTLSKTFFLAFGKKKELSALIEKLSLQITEKKEKIDKAQKQKDDYLVEHNNRLNSIDEKRSVAKKNAKDASVKLATTKKRVEKATTGLTTSKSALENANRACEAATEKYKQRSQAIASEEQARKRAEEETKKKADEAAKRHLAEEAQRQAEENARRRDEEAKRRAEEALRIKQIQESKAKEDVKKASANSTGPASITPKKFVRPYVADAKLSDTLNRAFDRLEKLFPEGKVFSFDSLDSDLRERMAELYKKAGYKTVDDMLRTYGFEIISGDEVRKIRSFVMYTPGNEPDVIKNKVNSMISRLNEYYPDRVITRGLQNDHKNLSKDVSGLYQWLGYESSAEMLKAYGFDVQYGDGTGGRPTNDYQALIDTLKEKYKDGNKLKAMGLLVHDNPELAGQIKTLQNQSNALFGMSLAKYFKEIGILGSSSVEISSHTEVAKSEKKKVYHYLIVSVEGANEPVLCATDTRTVHEGDFIEMCSLHSNVKMMGCVTETCYYTPEEDLPMPTEEMQQYIRKMLKSELKEIEASKVKYIFCSVRFEGRSDSLYYISPFEDIEVGDIVEAPHSWYGMAMGVVTKIERVSEKTAPYSVKKTKKIERVARRASEEIEKATESINSLASKLGTESFESSSVTTNVTELYEGTTYFASAVFRGMELDVRNALVALYPNEMNPLAHKTDLGEGISQFECQNLMVPQIIEKHPNLKAIFFAENWEEGNVYLAYSESGYASVTDIRLIGKCNFYGRDRWSLLHDPTEANFTDQGVQYSFAEKAKWESCDFVLPSGDKKLVAGKTILSKPYSKKATTDPCEIIEIRYPDNEIFYVAPQKSPKADSPGTGTQSGKLAGKTFVVTGDLENYPSRDELKAIIEQNGGRLTGSVSSKTTALITNYPNSGTAKIQKAHECGIEIIDENEFIRRYMSDVQ